MNAGSIFFCGQYIWFYWRIWTSWSLAYCQVHQYRATVTGEALESQYFRLARVIFVKLFKRKERSFSYTMDCLKNTRRKHNEASKEEEAQVFRREFVPTLAFLSGEMTFLAFIFSLNMTLHVFVCNGKLEKTFPPVELQRSRLCPEEWRLS